MVFTALKEGGIYLKNADYFNGFDYQDYCDLLQEISEQLGLNNMLGADSFLHEIYWKVKDK